MSTPAKYQQLTPRESVMQNPDQWAGAGYGLSSYNTICVDYSTAEINICSIRYSKLLYKMVDELIVNCLDQATLHKSVKKISIEFSEKLGIISVYNNGSFIPCVIDEKEKKYIPEMIFCNLLSGSNFTKATDKKTATGGKNGVGAKLANVFSTNFKLETVDSDNKVYYKQLCSRNMEITDAPIIVKSKDAPYTKITILPDYSKLGFEMADGKITQNDQQLLLNLIYTRALFSSFCTSAEVFYNGKKIETTVRDFIIQLTKVEDTDVFEFQLNNRTDKSLTWKLWVVVGSSKKTDLSFVNGVHTANGGRHVKFIYNTIYEKHEKLIKKTFGKREITQTDLSKHLSIFLVSNILSPSYTSQSKDYLDSPTEFNDIVIPKSFTGQEFSERLIQKLTDVLTDKPKTQTKKREFAKIKKYEGAINAGSKHSCYLFIPEGDSAALFINYTLKSNDKEIKKLGLTNENYGVYIIQGKPPNARKETVVISSAGDKKSYIKSTKMENNERFGALVKVLGLDYKHTYELTPEGDTQFKSLRYTGVIVAVDQDVDGVGHIFGLIINFFHLYWPALFKRDFVKRITTPLVIAKLQDKSQVNFYSEREYENWVNSRNIKHRASYFKGLATHNKESSLKVFRDFAKNVYTYTLDSLSDELFETYFGKDTTKRKEELRNTIVPYTPKNMQIVCNDYLRCEAREFQLENIIRNLPHVIDGLRPAARIALAGALDYFTSPTTHSVKVCELASSSALKFKYEHGAVSLEETIKTMNQSFPGARILPFLDGSESSFGSRSMGGDDAGASRYIKTKLNRELVLLVFPPADNHLLKYRKCENEKCEPLYYVPIIPMAILENFAIPATGWSCNIFARDYKIVFQNVRKMINASTDTVIDYRKLYNCIEKLPYWNVHSKAVVDEVDDKISITGIFKLVMQAKKSYLHITELPVGIWSKKWREMMLELSDSKPEYNVIQDIIDSSNDDTIDIKVYINSADIEPFKDEEYALSFLKITKKATSSCNLLGINNTIFEAVRELELLLGKEIAEIPNSGYNSILLTWFVERKELYIARVERMAIILRWKIIMLENTIKYVDNSKNYSVSNKDLDLVIHELTRDGYTLINSARVVSCADIPTNKLEESFIDGGNYNYLIDLRDRDKLTDSNKKRLEKLEELKKELEYITKSNKLFPGSHIWISELDKLEKCIDKGLLRKWNTTEY